MSICNNFRDSEGVSQTLPIILVLANDIRPYQLQSNCIFQNQKLVKRYNMNSEAEAPEATSELAEQQSCTGDLMPFRKTE
jgi:hypothetical protein